MQKPRANRRVRSGLRSLPAGQSRVLALKADVVRGIDLEVVDLERLELDDAAVGGIRVGSRLLEPGAVAPAKLAGECHGIPDKGVVVLSHHAGRHAYDLVLELLWEPLREERRPQPLHVVPFLDVVAPREALGHEVSESVGK